MIKPPRPKYYLAIALTALSTLASMGASFAAGRVFFDDFENGTTNQWTKDGNRNLCTPVGTAIDGGTPQAGSFMLQCNWNGHVPWNDPAAYSGVVLPSWSYSKEFLIRYWIRFDVNVDHAFNAKHFRLFNTQNSYVQRVEHDQAPSAPLYDTLERINGVTTSQTNNIQSDYSTVNLHTNHNPGGMAWHKVEIYMKIGLSGGSHIKVWVDGIKNHDWSGWNADPASKWYPMYLMSNWSNSPHDANNHVYWDNVEIFSDTGTGAIGSMSDATIGTGAVSLMPSPQNLR